MSMCDLAWSCLAAQYEYVNVTSVVKCIKGVGKLETHSKCKSVYYLSSVAMQRYELLGKKTGRPNYQVDIHIYCPNYSFLFMFILLELVGLH